MQTQSLTFNGTTVNVYRLNTVVLGSGAAGCNCAVQLYEQLQAVGVDDPAERILIVTAGRAWGTSRMSGSDKQTYYKLGTSPFAANSPLDFARVLTSGGACHGDHALIEGINSLRAFYHLVRLGVPFPHDPLGAFVGYKTDNDPYQSATSAGPLTSRFMSEALDRQLAHYGVQVKDHQEVIALWPADNGHAVLTLDRRRADRDRLELNLFLAGNVVLATGGPGTLFGTTVYPAGQCSVHGLALQAGLVGTNFDLWQFGLASTKFRWNVSGSYMQVIPRIYSSNPDGSDERDFLQDFFDDTGSLASAIFLKGYQWPFDAGLALEGGSSIIDLAVYQETVIRGRCVFMDFLHNVRHVNGGAFDIDKLSPEAREYLRANASTAALPIDRLATLNPLAIDLYRDHNIDLYNQPLQIAVCAQHQNGGLAVDCHWQTSVPGIFAVGEIAGTHGVYRPGGAALNAGQVGGIRAAQFIAHRRNDMPCPAVEEFQPQIERAVDDLKHVSAGTKGINAEEILTEIGRIMDRTGGIIRSEQGLTDGLEQLKQLRRQIDDQGICCGHCKAVPAAVRAGSLLITAMALLRTSLQYIRQGGGSRGSFLVASDQGRHPHEKLKLGSGGKTLIALAKDDAHRDVVFNIRYTGGDDPFDVWTEPTRPIPQYDKPFEVAWRQFREGQIWQQPV